MVSEHQVRERAYFIWEIEGRVSGHAEAHWLQAEAELTAPAKPLDKPLVIAAVQTTADHVPAPSAVLKPAAKKAKAAKAAKVEAPKAAKSATAKTAAAKATAAKTKRVASEGAALH